MKILFLQKDVIERMAITLFSAILKKKGHKCIVLVEDLEKKFVKKALALNPDIIAFSITSGEYAWMNRIGGQLRKKFTKLIICGGAHPTFYPEMINEEYLDAICIGEGEEAIVELVDALEKGKDITQIRNLYVKKEGKIYKNELRPLLDDLDKNPMPDRAIYDSYGFYRNLKNEFSGKSIVQTSRGCPFQCTFCFNKTYNDLYKGKGKIFRRRSVENVIREIKALKDGNPYLKFINFSDDVFTLPPRTWLDDFFIQYEKEVNLPFMIMTRADLLDEDLIKNLKKANCYSIKLGIESGDEYLRNTVLSKGITNQQIIKVTNLIKKNKIRLQLYNVLGIPGETLEAALKTFQFNKKLKPTYATCALLIPYPRTNIYKYASERHYLEINFDFKSLDYSIYTSTPIKMEHKREISNLQKIFAFGIFLNLPLRIIRFLIKLPFTKFYEIIFGISFWVGLLKMHRVRLINSLKVALINFTKYLFKPKDF